MVGNSIIFSLNITCNVKICTHKMLKLKNKRHPNLAIFLWMAWGAGEFHIKNAWVLKGSAAVIEGFMRNSAIYVGDSIVRKTDSRLNKEEDVVVCLPGAGT